MQPLHCHGDWLIDYADGALPPPQLAAAAQHLSQCPACQREAAALQVSGQRLSGYFTTLRASAASLPLPPGKRVGVRSASAWTSIAQRAAAIAAGLALIATGYWLNRPARVDVRPVEIVQHDPTPRETIQQVPQTAQHSAPDDDEIAAEIARETQIARLRAAIAILKEEPGMSERSAALQQYLSQAYQVDMELPSM
jgi:hypothetical protein